MRCSSELVDLDSVFFIISENRDLIFKLLRHARSDYIR